MGLAQRRLWNASIHYHGILLDALLPTAQRVLDAGCGDGLLAMELVQAGVRRVVAVDSGAGVLTRAKARHSGKPTKWMNRDIFGFDVAEEGPFDAVLSVATVHHMDAAAGLSRFVELVRPGGLVGVIGLAANDWWDLPCAAFGSFVRLAVSVRRGCWEHSAPMT